MQTYSINNRHILMSQTVNYQTRDNLQPLKMSNLTQDVFKKEISFSGNLKLFKKLNGVTSENISKLSRKEKAFLTQLASKNVPTEVVDDILKFTKMLKTGLDTKFGKEKYAFVSIGQSPAIFAETLKLMNVETAICPISGLTEADSLELILKNPELGKYFKYLKENGLDFNKIKSSPKQYIFTDYVWSGRSLDRFEYLITKTDNNSPNIKFIPLQSIPYSDSDEEDIFLGLFKYKYCQSCKLKASYSPSFKLAPENIHRAEDCRDKKGVNETFNMLKFLIINKMDKEKSTIKIPEAKITQAIFA